MKINKVYNESCIDTLKNMPAGFIDLVVTSPPYDGLRDYKGYCFDFNKIVPELYRVIKPGGVVVWVVGDQTKKGTESGTSFKQALAFMSQGFNLHDTMVYQKNSAAYPSNKNSKRYTQLFEYMFVFSKQEPKTANLIKDHLNRWAGYTNFGKKTGRTKEGKLINEGSLTIGKHGYRGNIWKYNVGKGYSAKDEIAHKHPAIFPEKLAYDHIITWSNENDLVYDPFLGSGTTALAAISAGRNYIGSEISLEYCKIIDERLMPLKNNLFTNQ